MKRKLLGWLPVAVLGAAVALPAPAMARGIGGGAHFAGRGFGAPGYGAMGYPWWWNGAYYGDYCWQQVWTPYGWQWRNVCWGY